MSASLTVRTNSCQAYQAYVTAGDTNTIFIKFSNYIDPYKVVSSSDFSVSLSGGAVSFADEPFLSSSFEIGQIHLLLSRTVSAGETGTVTYTANGTSEYIEDMAGNRVESFTLIIDNFVGSGDWYLPSVLELKEMYDELYLYSVGSFVNDQYWSSSEYSSTEALMLSFTTGLQSGQSKNLDNYVRACRSFNSTTNYSLRDTGPFGGLIFWKSGNSYLEAAPADHVSGDVPWSNIINLLIGTTNTAIGFGQQNTDAIISQAGHTTSAAKLCDDL